MQILSIHLKNIKSHRELDLEFSPGINVLSGPNGVGKSTIFEAIGYALFGVDAQSFVGNIDRFVSIGAKKGEIAVVFRVGEECYRVNRTVGTPARWLLEKDLDGTFEVEEHKDAKETETRLRELLGLDHGRPLAEQFQLVIGPFQSEFLGPFVEKRPTTRRNRFDEILGIDSWRKTFSETGALLKAIQGKIQILESAIGPLAEQVAVLPDKREAHKSAKQDLLDSETHYKGKQQELSMLESRLVEIDRREQQVRALDVEIDKLKERIGNGKEKIASQNTLIAAAEQAKKIVAENMAGKEAFEKTEQHLTKLREQLKLQRQLERELAELNTTVSKLEERHKGEAKAIEQTGKDLEDEKKSLAEKRDSLAINQTVAKLAARLPEISEALTGARTELGRLEGRRVGLEEGQEKLAEGICPFFQEPCLNIAERPPGDVFSDKLAVLDLERQRLQTEISALEKTEAEAKQANESIKAFEVQLKGLDDLEEKLTAKLQAYRKRSAGLGTLKQEQTEAQQQVAEKRKALEAFNHLQIDIETAETEQRKHQASRDRYVAHQEQAAKLEGLQADLQTFAALLTQLQNELSAKERERVETGQQYDAEQHQALRQQKDALRQEVGALGQKVAGLKVDVERLSGEIDKLKQLEQLIAEKKQQIKAYGDKEGLVKFLRNRVFNKVSASLSERFREEISQRANRIYRIIAESDEELAWGEDYRIVLRDMVDGALRERADDQLSGGQTMSAVVALRLALLQTIGARVAFFDEPTSNLDAVRRENLARAFRAIDVGKEEVTEHWYDQLFLISHDVAFAEITDQLLDLESAPSPS